MTIFLVRHAHAGKRSEWDGDDCARPLSARGEDQARGIAELLAGHPVRRIVSSPFLRCLQTVAPLASVVGTTVEGSDDLAEGAHTDQALRLLLALDADDGVACTHGDLIPPLLRELVAMGMEVDGALLDQKGSVWTIHTRTGRPVRGEYTPPSA